MSAPPCDSAMSREAQSPDAGPCASRLRREEALEDAVGDGAVDAGAGVADGQRRVRLGDHADVDRDACSRAPPGTHRSGVQEEIQRDLIELGADPDDLDRGALLDDREGDLGRVEAGERDGVRGRPRGDRPRRVGGRGAPRPGALPQRSRTRSVGSAEVAAERAPFVGGLVVRALERCDDLGDEERERACRPAKLVNDADEEDADGSEES